MTVANIGRRTQSAASLCMVCLLSQFYACEHPRPQLAVAIRELSLDRERPRRRIDDAANYGHSSLEDVARIGVDGGLDVLAVANVRDLLFRNAEAELERRGLNDDQGHGGVAEPLTDVG